MSRPADALGRCAAPLVGLALFLELLRYQGFLLWVFPSGRSQWAFLAALALAAALCTLGWRRVCGLLSHRGGLVFLACVAGSAATAIAATLQPSGAAGLLLVCVVAVGFSSCVLMWAGYLSTGFSERKYVLLLLAYPLSVALMYVPRTLQLGELAASPVMALSGLAWLLARPRTPEPEAAAPQAPAPKAQGRRALSVRAMMTGLLDLADMQTLAVASFVLIGSVIRGLIDRGVSPDPDRRMLVVLLMSAAALGVSAWAYLAAGRRAPRAGAGGTTAAGRAEQGRRWRAVTGACWSLLALCFLTGSLMFLADMAAVTGAYLCTTACSIMLLLYYSMLGDLCERRSVNYVPVFSTYGILFWIACFALSYAVVPSAAQESSAGKALVLVSTLALIALGVVVLSLLGSRKSGAELAAGRTAVPGGSGRPEDAGGDRAGCQEAALVRDRGLTEREARVAVLYAGGYSLGRVAEEMGVTKGAAQGYVKGAYRKLGVHSKNELVDLLGAGGGAGGPGLDSERVPSPRIPPRG